jgi:hypothetical protein
MRASVIALVLASFCFSAVAQDFPGGHVYGGYSYLNIDTNGLSSRQNANGWEAGGTFNINYWLGIEGSGAGYYKTYSLGPYYGTVNVHDYSFGLGPRFNYRGFRSTTVFAHALLGGDTLTGNDSGLSASQTGFATILGGGVERSIHRSPWALRLSADYVVSHHDILGPQSYTQNNFRATVGIKYSFGGLREQGPMNLTRQAPKEPKEKDTSKCVGTQDVPALGITGCAFQGGFLVVTTRSGGAAANAGIQVGDLISEIDGRAVQSALEIAVATAEKSAVTIVYVIQGKWTAERQIRIR